MESEFFTWDGCDKHDLMCFSFYDAELLVDIGDFKKGSKFASIIVDYGESPHIEFWQHKHSEKPTAKYALKLQIGEKLS